jgi:NitT/TauT family transport system permease protein
VSAGAAVLPADPSAPERPRQARAGWLLPPVVAGLAGLGVWALLAARPGSALPSPAQAAHAFAGLVASGDLAGILGRTLALLLLGFAGAVAVGVALGIALGQHRWTDQALSPYLIGLQSLPNAVLVPLGVVVAGTGAWTVLGLTVVAAAPAVAIGTRDAIHSIPPLLVRAARTMGAQGATLVRRVAVPAALPGIVDALQFGWAFAFRAVVAAEIIIGTGIGAFLKGATAEGRIDQVLVVVVVVLAVGILVDRLGFARARRSLRARRGLAVAGEAP